MGNLVTTILWLITCLYRLTRTVCDWTPGPVTGISCDVVGAGRGPCRCRAVARVATRMTFSRATIKLASPPVRRPRPSSAASDISHRAHLRWAVVVVAVARTSWGAKISGRRLTDAGGAPHRLCISIMAIIDSKSTSTIITITRSTGTTCLRIQPTAEVVVRATTIRQTT